MTVKEAKALQPVFNAFAEGKPIQWYDEFAHAWCDLVEASFEGDAEDYRIKPESEYRPFKDSDELMRIADVKSLWLVSKASEAEYIITGCTKGTVRLDYNWYTMKELLEHFTFCDGTPCGVEEVL